MRFFRPTLVWLLVGAGSAAIAYPALAYGTGALRQSRLAAEIRTLIGPAGSEAGRQLGTASSSAAVVPIRSVGEPASASRGAPSNPASLPSYRAVEGQALGLIQIPSVGLEVAFLEGVSDETLMAGPGHLPGTALPGTGDVSVLAAHRDAHFRNLKDVDVGDTVTLRLPSGSVVYRVTGRAIANPDDRWVTIARGRPMLRLVTCWPPNFIGPAPDRLVVTAQPLKAPSAPLRPEFTTQGDAAEGRSTPRRPSGAISDASPGTVSEPESPDLIALTAPADGLFPGDSLPPIGTAGAAAAALAAFGAYSTRRQLKWWFLPWMGGLGLTALILLAAWAGPRFVATA
ncbi:hypothetical protein BH20ACT24_BH20ACT24_08400 [soil metagenome]